MKKHFIYILLALPIAQAAQADDQPQVSQIESIYGFVQTNVATKKFRIKNDQVLPSGLKSEFQRTVVISSVTRSTTELAFNIAFDVKQNLFEPAGNGEWSATPINKDRIGAYRCLLNEQRATQEVIGNCHIIMNTIGDTGNAESIRLKLVDGHLTTTLLTVGYYSSSQPQGGALPGRTRMIWDHALTTEGKVAMAETVFTWKVNAELLEPTSAEVESHSPAAIGE